MILLTLATAALLAGGLFCKSEQKIEPSPVQVRNEACMEECRARKCEAYQTCYEDCEAANMQPAIAACTHKCDIRFQYCQDACASECDARYPGEN